MNEILSREKIYEWEMRPYGYATGVECGIYPHELEQLYDSHEALRERVGQLERVVDAVPEPCGTIWCQDSGGLAAYSEWVALRNVSLETSHE